MRRVHSLLGSAIFVLLSACSKERDPGSYIGGGASGNTGGTSPGGAGSSGGGNGPGIGGFGGYIDFGDAGRCPPVTCAGLGWACGYTVDMCGNVVDCADEGLTCGDNEVCVGGIDGPTRCQTGADPTCELCQAVPDCSGAAQQTRLSGRVITPGRNDANTANQVGVPNAVVYIMRTDQIDDLPEIPSGIPTDGLSCDRCEDQNLGPLLAGAITDATGRFVIEGNVPVGVEFLLVVKAGKFRRVVPYTLAAGSACTTTALDETLPNNPTRLPRDLADGLAVHMPKIAISTGRIDAMECVFEKMGIAHTEFGNPGSDASVKLYRGKGPTGTAEGARIDDSTPNDSDLYGSLATLQTYDMVVSDCEGNGWDGAGGTFAERVANGDKVREYVNRGGRMFASHLSMSWLHQNGTQPYSDGTPLETGLGPAAQWRTTFYTDADGDGHISTGRTHASPRIENFATWMAGEGVSNPFVISDPRSMLIGTADNVLGDHTEEFVYRDDSPLRPGSAGNSLVQQFSFNTPYGAPEAATCGRVAYSGFHVAVTGGGSNPFASSVFPAHCTGNLTNQEKVLLYMLFDLGACVGDEPLPPPCVPLTCSGSGSLLCGFQPDGCGNVLDCGPCRPPA